jgi:hypothetical protein
MKVQAMSFLVEDGSDPEPLKAKVRSRHKGALVQTVDSRLATNAFFVEMIAAQTVRAAETGNLLADKPEIDFLLRIAGTTQISVALKQAGSKEREPFILVVSGYRGIGNLRPPPGGTRLPRRSLSEEELDAVERAALLNVARA